jgi:Arc/MetJ family transcription regulator
MRTRITIEDSLLAHARALSGLQGNRQLVNAALQALIFRESEQRLASLARLQGTSKYGAHRRDYDL